MKVLHLKQQEDQNKLVLPEEFTRFRRIHIAEHWMVMVLFLALVVTGIPQRYFESSVSHAIVWVLGGIDIVRAVHRVSGILFAMLAFWHLGRVILLILLKKMTPAMLPTPKDFRDAIACLQYYLGRTQNHPKFDRYDFRQKFEYFGLLLGGMVMIVTGFILYFPVFFTSFLPGVIIPAAKTAHGYEAMLAFSVILIWHMYGAHLNPDIFPFDSSIFTGKISRERMEKEHPIELERMVQSMEE